MTATKGPSNLYGNKNQRPTDKINYPYAKGFNTETLYNHFSNHGREMGLNSITDYENSAIKFANNISTVADSFVDEFGSTYKYNFDTKKFIIVDKTGKIITYFKPVRGDQYFLDQKKNNKVVK